MPPQFIDIHTHSHAANDVACLQMRNYHSGFDQVPAGQFCSMGLHPWYLQHAEADMYMLCQSAKQPHVLAIGECGLDRVCATDWALQVVCFKKQILLANKLQKPLVIHCVRAFNEVAELLAEGDSCVPAIYHGFNKKLSVAEPLLCRGAYLSFGEAIFRAHLPAASVLAAVPADRFFLETDDSAISIADIYERAAQIRNTEVEAIILQVQKNFNSVFKI